MGSIVIDVMLKSEILDPQGQAVRGALPRLGFSGFTDVRQGKRFVLTVDGDVTEEHLASAREAAEKLLSNPVIEDVVSVRSADEVAAAPTKARTAAKASSKAGSQPEGQADETSGGAPGDGGDSDEDEGEQ